MKKTNTKSKLPSIYRIINEKVKKLNPKLIKFYTYFSIILTFVVAIFLLLLIGFISFDLGKNFTRYQSLHAQRQSIVSKINFWSSIAQKYPGYPDAYLNMASLYFELNDLQRARKYIDQALLLNPDYDKAIELEKKISQKGY
ncbi:MAG: tetratricopeptide repeat protein [Candidatus Levybacteria bacterium]|nr:tetratricopeptide repeat protein [Candidatus Levybacteria bacterium]